MRHPLVRWSLALAFACAAVWLVARDPGPLRQLLHIDLTVLIAMAALIAVNQALLSLRIGYAVEECSSVSVPKWTWFRLTSVGQFLNLLFPQLGNVYRAFILKRDHGIGYAQYAAGLFTFVWIDLLIGLAFAIVSIAILDPTMRIGELSGLAVLVTILLGVLIAPFLIKRLLATRESGRIARLRVRATILLETATRFLHDGRYLSRAFTLNVLLVATQLASIHLAFDAVGAVIDFPRLMLFQVLVRLSNQIVVTPGNLGLTEVAYGVLAGASGSTMQHGVAAGLLIRALGSAVVVVLGLALGGAGHLIHRDRLRATSPTS